MSWVGHMQRSSWQELQKDNGAHLYNTIGAWSGVAFGASDAGDECGSWHYFRAVRGVLPLVWRCLLPKALFFLQPRTRFLRAPPSLALPFLPPPPFFRSIHSKLSSVCKKVPTRGRSPSYERLLVGCSSASMRLAEHLTVLRAWCKQCLPGR